MKEIDFFPSLFPGSEKGEPWNQCVTGQPAKQGCAPLRWRRETEGHLFGPAEPGPLFPKALPLCFIYKSLPWGECRLFQGTEVGGSPFRPSPWPGSAGDPVEGAAGSTGPGWHCQPTQAHGGVEWGGGARSQALAPLL